MSIQHPKAMQCVMQQLGHAYRSHPPHQHTQTLGLGGATLAGKVLMAGGCADHPVTHITFVL